MSLIQRMKDRLTRSRPSPKLSMKSIWSTYANPDIGNGDDNFKKINGYIQKFSEEARRGIAEWLFRVEAESLKNDRPLPMIRASLIDLADQQMSALNVMDIDAAEREKISGELKVNLSPESLAFEYLEIEIKIAILRLYAFANYDDGGPEDWFAYYAKLSDNFNRLGVGLMLNPSDTLRKVCLSASDFMKERRELSIQSEVGASFQNSIKMLDAGFDLNSLIGLPFLIIEGKLEACNRNVPPEITLAPEYKATFDNTISCYQIFLFFMTVTEILGDPVYRKVRQSFRDSMNALHEAYGDRLDGAVEGIIKSINSGLYKVAGADGKVETSMDMSAAMYALASDPSSPHYIRDRQDVESIGKWRNGVEWDFARALSIKREEAVKYFRHVVYHVLMTLKPEDISGFFDRAQ